MSQLDSGKRAKLPDSAFAYVDSKGHRRLPINDEAHVRNALARFNQVVFEDEAARERARKKLLVAARKHGIVPIGFMTGQLEDRTSEATAGRLVVDLGKAASPAEFERRVRAALRDPALSVLHWSESAAGYLDRDGQIVALNETGSQLGVDRITTLLERQGRPMTALVHSAAVPKSPVLMKAVTEAVRLTVENDRLRGQIQAQASDVRTLPTGTVTFLLTDIEGSTGLLQRLGDRYAALLADTRAVIRGCVHRAEGREIDARADEFFAVFVRASGALQAALEIQRGLRARAWPEGVSVKVRAGIHSGRPTLTDTGYIGLAVHTAARICSAENGGQILLSAAARDALGRSRPSGFRLRGLGSHRFHGLREPLTVVQVEGPDLQARFPPLRTHAVSAPGSGTKVV